jgi:hypothetical protein
MKAMRLSRFLSGAIAGAALAVTVALSSGCFLVAVGAAAGAGAGAVAYVKGELTATLDATFERTVHASDGALEQLHIALISQSGDSLSTVLTARTSEDTKLTITVNRLEANTNLAQVRIRVGVFGNEQLSRTILDQIKKNL